MKYLLIEHPEAGNKAIVHVCDSPVARERQTAEALYDKGDVRGHEEEFGGQLMVLANEGKLHFEGDPPLEWLDAEVIHHLPPGALGEPYRVLTELDGLKYALGLVQRRRVLKRTPDFLAALDELTIFLEAAIERVEHGGAMHSTATVQ